LGDLFDFAGVGQINLNKPLVRRGLYLNSAACELALCCGVLYFCALIVSCVYFKWGCGWRVQLSAKDLASFLVVLVPFSRAAAEFRKDPGLAAAAQAAAAVKDAANATKRRDRSGRQARGKVPTVRSDGDAAAFGAARSRSPLLDVLWLRLVIDEGHELLGTRNGLLN
jgi:hypothetical protein